MNITVARRVVEAKPLKDMKFVQEESRTRRAVPPGEILQTLSKRLCDGNSASCNKLVCKQPYRRRTKNWIGWIARFLVEQ